MISLVIMRNTATVTLCRPPVNAINEDWIDHLDSALDDIAANEEIGVLWIRSAERLFSTGADLNLMRGRYDTAGGRELMVSFVRRIQQVFARIENMNAVSVAEISGAAMGGGLELALSCDLRVIADSARVGLPEARLGLLPGAGGTQRMTRRCGDAVARRLILGAEIVDGKAAQQLNIAHWSVADAGIEKFADDLVARLAALPAAALAACKRCITAAHDGAQDGFEIELANTRTLLAAEETHRRIHQFLGGTSSPALNSPSPAQTAGPK